MPSGYSRWRRAGLPRVLFESSIWVELWGSLKRVHKDRRARRRLAFLSLGVALLVLLVAAVVVYLALMVGTGAIFFIPFVIPVLWWLRRSANREFQAMNIVPQWARPEGKTEAANEGRLRRYFADLALLYAVLVDRAGSERFLKEKALPPEVEVTSRRLHMDALRANHLWARISLKDREALMMPDGAWGWEKINVFATGIEPLRLLRWILRLDFRLPTIGQQLTGDFSTAHEFVVDPDRLRRSSDLVEDSAVRVARDDAHSTLLRCIAEAITRGYQVAEDEKTETWAKEFAAELSGDQNADFLLGNELVSEANPDRLAWATALANIRTDFLSAVLDLLDTGRPPEGPLTSIFAEEDESVAEPR